MVALHGLCAEGVNEWQGHLSFTDVVGEALLLGILMTAVLVLLLDVDGSLNLTRLCGLNILIVIPSLEESTDKFHQKARIQSFVCRCFRAHQLSNQDEEAPSLCPSC